MSRGHERPKTAQQKAHELWKKGLARVDIARQAGVPMGTIGHWITGWRGQGESPTVAPVTMADVDEDHLKKELKTLRSLLKKQGEDELSTAKVRSEIFKLSTAPFSPPDWTIATKTSAHSPGIPTLLASDWHHGEVVDPAQVPAEVNEYNIDIAHARARLLIERTIDLLTNHMVNPTYPGIVFALGGDMVSGDIHEELLRTNELDIMPTVIDLVGVLRWCILQLADRFGRVFIPCVTGNHGRNTHKMRSKGRNTTNFDWLIYTILEKIFETDKRVAFYVATSSDARYNVYNHRYLLTHGDQFRGGDGMIGALGPIIRGDHKKRSRNAQVGWEYDTLLMGHWHQLIQLQRLIVNGSLKGYDEYAAQNNFGYEIPRQALWLTHPKHGITISMPVNVADAPNKKETESWVEWAK